MTQAVDEAVLTAIRQVNEARHLTDGAFHNSDPRIHAEIHETLSDAVGALRKTRMWTDPERSVAWVVEHADRAEAETQRDRISRESAQAVADAQRHLCEVTKRAVERVEAAQQVVDKAKEQAAT